MQSILSSFKASRGAQGWRSSTVTRRELIGLVGLAVCLWRVFALQSQLTEIQRTNENNTAQIYSWAHRRLRTNENNTAHLRFTQREMEQGVLTLQSTVFTELTEMHSWAEGRMRGNENRIEAGQHENVQIKGEIQGIKDRKGLRAPLAHGMLRARLDASQAVAKLSWDSSADSLTLISCPKVSCDAHTRVSQRLAILSWLAIEPQPQIVLVGDERSRCIEELLSLGPDGSVSYVDVSGDPDAPAGAPLIPAIIEAGEAVATSGLIMYINSDIVMPPSYGHLVLTAMRANYKKHMFSDHLFMTAGKRFKRPPMIVGSRIDCGQLDLEQQSFAGVTDVHAAVMHSGRCFLGPCNGADYFVFLKGFWSALRTPGFVVGRMHWDSFFLAAGRMFGYEVDLSPVLPALHIIHHYGNIKGNPSRAGIFSTPEALRNGFLAMQGVGLLGMSESNLQHSGFNEAPTSRMCPSCEVLRGHLRGHLRGKSFEFIESTSSLEIFDTFDKDKSGSWEGSEIEAWAYATYDDGTQVSSEAAKGRRENRYIPTADKMFDADQNSDGQVSKEEFVKSRSSDWPLNYCYPHFGSDRLELYQATCLEMNDKTVLLSDDAVDGYCLKYQENIMIATTPPSRIENYAAFWGCPCCSDQCRAQTTVVAASALFASDVAPILNDSACCISGWLCASHAYPDA